MLWHSDTDDIISLFKLLVLTLTIWCKPSRIQRWNEDAKMQTQCLFSRPFSAWWGFTTTDRIEAVIRRGVRAGLYPADGPTAAQLVEDYNDTLLVASWTPSSMCCMNFSLPKVIITMQSPAATTQSFLSCAMDHRNFIPRLAFKDTYQHSVLSVGLPALLYRRSCNDFHLSCLFICFISDFK